MHATALAFLDRIIRSVNTWIDKPSFLFRDLFVILRLIKGDDFDERLIMDSHDRFIRELSAIHFDAAIAGDDRSRMIVADRFRRQRTSKPSTADRLQMMTFSHGTLTLISDCV